MCVNESLFRALQTSPVVLLVSHRLNYFADIFSVLCMLFHHLSPHPAAVLSFDVSWLSKIMYTWTAKNWIQYSASHVAYTATTALLLSKNGIPPDPPSLAWLCMHTHHTPTSLQKSWLWACITINFILVLDSQGIPYRCMVYVYIIYRSQNEI